MIRFPGIAGILRSSTFPLRFRSERMVHCAHYNGETALTNTEEIDSQRDYLSYMLRMWRDGRAGEAVWRASLQSPHSGDVAGFASLDDLFAFLRRQAGLDPAADDGQQEE